MALHLPLIIDAHTQVFPDHAEQLYARVSHLLPKLPEWTQIRRAARGSLRPLSVALHRAQPLVRHFPGPIRRLIDPMGALAGVPGFLVEGIVQELLETLKAHHAQYAIVAAHPPLSPNEFILEQARIHKNLIPLVNLPPTERFSLRRLKSLISRGAKGLKIHPVADALLPTDAHYKKLIATATDSGLPVYLHTGTIDIPILYPKPEFGHIEHFEPLFQSFPSTRFVISHLNYHFPELALRAAEKHPQILVSTSWQPSEVMGEANRRIGSERILLASDWPLYGDGLEIALERLNDAVDAGWITPEEARNIAGINAAKLFGLQTKP